MRRPASPPGLPAALAFTSLGGFGDVQGTGIAAQYLAQRNGAPGTPGWTTHAITPKQDPGTLKGGAAALAPGYDAELSDDLTTGVFRAWTPLTDAPNVAQVTDNLYAREDLRTPGPGSYRLLTDAATLLPPASLPDPFLQQPRVAAATAGRPARPLRDQPRPHRRGHRQLRQALQDRRRIGPPRSPRRPRPARAAPRAPASAAPPGWASPPSQLCAGRALGRRLAR